MFCFLFRSTRIRRWIAGMFLAGLSLAMPLASAAKMKQNAGPAVAVALGRGKFPLNPKALAWPSPPNVARIPWLVFFAGAKIDYTPQQTAKPKASWMDRLAG